MTIGTMITDGYGWEDICVSLRIADADDQRKIRNTILRSPRRAGDVGPRLGRAGAWGPTPKEVTA